MIYPDPGRSACSSVLCLPDCMTHLQPRHADRPWSIPNKNLPVCRRWTVWHSGPRGAWGHVSQCAEAPAVQRPEWSLSVRIETRAVHSGSACSTTDQQGIVVQCARADIKTSPQFAFTTAVSDTHFYFHSGHAQNFVELSQSCWFGFRLRRTSCMGVVQCHNQSCYYMARFCTQQCGRRATCRSRYLREGCQRETMSLGFVLCALCRLMSWGHWCLLQCWCHSRACDVCVIGGRGLHQQSPDQYYRCDRNSSESHYTLSELLCQTKSYICTLYMYTYLINVVFSYKNIFVVHCITLNTYIQFIVIALVSYIIIIEM